MFHSAALKLTGWYLAIIMVISIAFSAALYHVSSIDLGRNISRQVGYFNNLLSVGDAQNYSDLRNNQLNEDLDHLKANLVLFNLVVLASGGVASYALARRTLEPIEDSLEAQKRFASDASHELRTPLTAMQTEIEVALRNPKLTKDAAVRLLSSNLEEVAKLRNLSEALLKLATLGTDNLPIDKVNVKDVASHAVEQKSKLAKTKNISITTKLSDVYVMGDQQSLIQLISIIIDNAIKYSPPGSEIVISTQELDRNCLVTVKDSGVGINKSDLPRIFDRFFQADSSRSESGKNGYGLGLALAKKIVDSHHGLIEVKSAVGKGSDFGIRIPLA